MDVRRTDVSTAVLACMFVPVLVMLSAGVLAAREPASGGAVVDFVRDHLPRITGSVVQSDTEGIFVELEGRPHSLRVTVSRRSVEVVDGERRVRRRRIGRADLVPEGDRLGRLRADTELRSRIRKGDRVTWTVDTLWLIREEGPDLAELKRRLARVERIGRVEHLSVGDDRASGLEEGAVVLRFGAETIVLKRVGELGELGRMSRYRAPQRPSGPRLKKAARFERRVYDFDWVAIPGRDVRIVVLGGNNTLGLARWEDGPRRMHWHSVTGKVLSVSTLDRRARNPEALPILVVTKHQQDVKSHLYHYDMMERELTRSWSASRIWMRRVGDSVVGQTMGMNQPFDGSIYPIHPREDGWSWGDDPDPKFAACSRLPSCRPLGGGLLNLTSIGRLNLVRGEDDRTRAHGTFGGSPLWLSAPRSEKKVDLHPQYTGWVRLDGPSSVLLPYNRYSGTGIIRAMRSFDEATLHLLSVTEDELETRWRSDRRTGFFTRVRGGPSVPWATLVDQETYHTTLYRIEGTDYPGW